MLLEIPAHFGRKQMSRNFSDSAFSQGGTIRKNLDREESRKGMENMRNMKAKTDLGHVICNAENKCGIFLLQYVQSIGTVQRLKMPVFVSDRI